MKNVVSFFSLLMIVLLISGCTNQWYKKSDDTTEIKPLQTKEEQTEEVEQAVTVETTQSEGTQEESSEASSSDVPQEDVETNENSEDELTEEGEESAEETVEEEVVIDQKAKDLNSSGFEKYKEGAFEEALELFRESMAEDDDYFYAHYNYACTLGVLMKEDYPEWYGRRSEVYEHLKKVLELNPDYIAKFKTDSDLDLLREDYEYYELIGYSADNPDDVQVFLENVNWYIQGAGVFTVLGGLDIKEDNRFRLHHLDYTKMDNADFVEHPIVYEGSYTITDGTIYFTLDEEMPKSIVVAENGDPGEMVTEFTGTITQRQIQLDILNYPLYSWYDEFSA